MLRLDKLTYRVGPRVLFDQATASIPAGHRVGFVGRNGTGKTTLLRMIAGEIEPHEGVIARPARWRVGLTSQEAPGGEASLLDTVLACDHELAALTREAETARDPRRLAEIHARLDDRHAHAAPARAARILAGLGFPEAAQRRPCAAFSGGWRMRVALAGLLFLAPDLLLLDEPTNHLDLEASLWLEDYLRRYPGTVLLVSHDRGLLNRVPNATLHLEGGKLTLYAGGYDRFEETRAARIALDDKRRARQQAEIARIQGFVERFRFKASKARQAQSRLKHLARLKPIPEFPGEETVAFAFPDPEPLASPLYGLDKVDIGYDGEPVLRRVSLRLDADDRIGLLGANGNGKSTLIKLLAGRLAPLRGEVRKSGKLGVGYFAQHQAEELDGTATPLLELGRRLPRAPEERLRAQLGRFGFSRERAETPVAALSGGEKARLLFALMSAAHPHVLLLDEPTNHLDVSAREALVRAINAFAGAVVIVSHDPRVLDLTCDRFWLVADGGVRPFDGTLLEYRASLLARSEAGAAAPAAVARKEQRRRAGERRQALAPLRKELAAAEAAVQQLEAKKAKVLTALADPSLYADGAERAVALHRRLAEIEHALEAAEALWLRRQEAWDEATLDAGDQAGGAPL